jgi:hypothetical protein
MRRIWRGLQYEYSFHLYGHDRLIYEKCKKQLELTGSVPLENISLRTVGNGWKINADVIDDTELLKDLMTIRDWTIFKSHSGARILVYSLTLEHPERIFGWLLDNGYWSTYDLSEAMRYAFCLYSPWPNDPRPRDPRPFLLFVRIKGLNYHRAGQDRRLDALMEKLMVFILCIPLMLPQYLPESQKVWLNIDCLRRLCDYL